MASAGHIERLACAETVLFRFAIRERKPAVYIVLKNRQADNKGRRIPNREKPEAIHSKAVRILKLRP
jgi:hypothetical protein